ncbi:MAG: hypothetical protein AAGJ31_14515 [Verrucomicrobiota bacterium]
MIEQVAELPEGCKKLPHRTLAFGEVTGHSHRISETVGSTLFQAEGTLFLEVEDEKVSLIHEEHGTIPLKRGSYRVWRQREYSPEEIRIIRD